ncbi:MAG: DNA-3-methyladenine glycosylase I [Bacteroidia bacterium]|nr:DNA-3-methyladenine glycosylase I [Bacteroidia bacterium]
MQCTWPGNDEKMLHYHDNEWGTAVHDDLKHFEFLLLDCFQAGLSWKTILHRRKNFKKAFAHFNYKKIAKFNEDDVQRLMNDAGIIRNKLKITGTIKNAKAFIEVQKEFGSFDAFIWQFTEHKQIVTKVKTPAEIRATSPESDAMSKALKKRGFTFVGSTICYAYMQAAGMINDHLVSCKRFKEVQIKK